MMNPTLVLQADSSFIFRSKPLQIWDNNVRNGHIKRITDQDIQSSVLEIMGIKVVTVLYHLCTSFNCGDMSAAHLIYPRY